MSAPLGPSRRVRPALCPYCGVTIELAASAEGVPDPTPAAGDVALCAACGGIAAYTDAGTLRLASLKDLAGWTPSRVARLAALRLDILVRRGTATEPPGPPRGGVH